MRKDARQILKFILEETDLEMKHIIILGRSMGAAVAAALAKDHSQKAPALIVLLSPFHSLREISRQHAGACASYLVSDCFNTAANLSELDPICPLLLVHGTADTLVPVSNSQMLHDMLVRRRGSNNRTKLNLREGNTHTSYHVFQDIVVPICEFMLDQGISNLASGVSEKGIAMKDRTKDIFERCSSVYVPPKSERSLSTCLLQHCLLTMRILVLLLFIGFHCLVILRDLPSQEGSEISWTATLILFSVLFLFDVMTMIAYCIRNPRILLFTYCVEPLSILALLSAGAWQLFRHNSSLLANEINGYGCILLAFFYVLLHPGLHR